MTEVEMMNQVTAMQTGDLLIDLVKIASYIYISAFILFGILVGIMSYIDKRRNR